GSFSCEKRDGYRVLQDAQCLLWLPRQLHWQNASCQWMNRRRFYAVAPVKKTHQKLLDPAPECRDLSVHLQHLAQYRPVRVANPLSESAHVPDAQRGFSGQAHVFVKSA